VNPDYELVEKDGEIVDVKIVYKSDFTEQMLHYSTEWSFLPSIN
jgi:dipeptidyl-peptidase-3